MHLAIPTALLRIAFDVLESPVDMLRTLVRQLSETSLVLVFVGIGCVLGLTLLSNALANSAHSVGGSVLFVFRSSWLGPWIPHRSPQTLDGSPVGIDSAPDLGVFRGQT